MRRHRGHQGEGTWRTRYPRKRCASHGATARASPACPATLRWRAAHDRELVWTVDPTHPIARGVPHPLVIDEEEMYGEFFDIPAPDELVFLSTFSGGEVFRSGCTFRRGHGKVFYFRPGDQEYPTYHHPDVRRVIANAVEWAGRRHRGHDALSPVLSMP